MLGNDRGVDTATDVEFRGEAHETRHTGAHQVIEDMIGDRLVEAPFLAVGPDVAFQRFEFNATLVRYVFDVQGSEVGLTGLGAETGKFGDSNANRIIPLRGWIIEDLELS